MERRKRQSLRRQIIACANEGLSMDTQGLVGQYKIFFEVVKHSMNNILFFFYSEFNPNLENVQHGARVAYVKFMAKKIKREVKFTDETEIATIENEKRNSSTRSSQRSIDRVVMGSIVSISNKMFVLKIF